MIRLVLTLHMDSDWHIGTGTATRGLVTSNVIRDDTGLPYVPATSLVGVWRDSCEVAAHALDAGERGAWHEWVNYLFGSEHSVTAEVNRPLRPPRPAALWVAQGLRLPDDLRAALVGHRRVQQAATFVKPGVSTDPATGAAREDMYRLDEMTRSGLDLTSVAELTVEDLTDRQRDRACALLAAGAQLLEAIGGKRRRGAGRCRLSLSSSDPRWPASVDRAMLTGDAPAPPAPPQPAALSDVDSTPGHGWETVTLQLRLETPVIAQRRVVGNTVFSHDHIPGWAMMPAVLRKLGGGSAGALARRGDLVVTSATMCVDGRRALPVPRVFATAADDPDTALNQTAASVASTKQSIRSGYLAGTGQLHHQPRTDRMHNTIQDGPQRPTTEVGGVYTYQALPAGTQLCAEVRIRSGGLPAGWSRRLAGTWRLGRASRAGYGTVAVTVEPDPAPAVTPGVTAGDTLRVWLLTDTLVDDLRLRPSSDPRDLADALQSAFAAAGATVGLVADPRPGERAEVCRIDGWHRGWGLPRSSLLGFAAGSCLTFRVTSGSVSAAALTEVSLAGVGLRRGEGFGQLRFNDPVVDTPTLRIRHAEPPTHRAGQPLRPGHPAEPDARLLERAAWREAIRRRCEEIASTPEVVLGGLNHRASPTQLNAARQILPHLDQTGRVERWLEWLGATATRRAQWPDQTRQRLTALFTDSGRVWQLLALPEAELSVTASGPAELRADLWAETVRRLVTACCARRSTSEREDVEHGA